MKEFRRRRIPADRVENGIGSGMPDINASYPQRDAWIELKAGAVPNDMSTNFDFYLRPAQWQWLRSRPTAYRMVAARCGTVWYVWYGAWELLVRPHPAVWNVIRSFAVRYDGVADFVDDSLRRSSQISTDLTAQLP